MSAEKNRQNGQEMSSPGRDARCTDALLESISELIRNKGFRNLTMDSVSRTLGMSKRTLYEIFGSKEAMTKTVIAYHHVRLHEEYDEIFRHASNVMEGVVKVFIRHRDLMSNVSADFFRDIHELYPELKDEYQANQKQLDIWMEKFFRQGMSQGVFRSDVDFRVMCQLYKVQLESLKRMEDHFPPDLTLIKAFETITIGFLRSIASPEGMKIVDRMTSAKIDNQKSTTK